MYQFIADKTRNSIKPWHALAALVLLNILIALYIGNGFGEGWDETRYYLYGERSLDAYIRGMQGLELIPKKHIFYFNLRYYGPFYAVIGKLTTEILQNVVKKWSHGDVWHYVNFIFFQGGLICLYLVAKRFMRPWVAFGIVVLFATQPLIFGHAFINPKDIPFMTFFLASIASGLFLVDAQERKLKSAEIGISSDTPKNAGQFHGLMAAILFGLLILTIVGRDVYSSLVGYLVSFFYYSSPASIGGRLFLLFANQSNQLPVENYIHKVVSSRIDQVVVLSAMFLVLAKTTIDAYAQNRKTWNAKKYIYDLDFYFIGAILIAGVILGLTTSIRLLGPFAGLLIMGQSLMTVGKKSIPSTIYYFSIAALTIYLTWPFLWESPTYRFIEAVEVMKNFPFDSSVKFMGSFVAPDNLPWMYIPLLMTIQLTEPVIILFIIGFIASLRDLIRNPGINKNIFIIYSWFIIPIGLFIILHSNGYDNFRQFFFVLPPIFILSGIALDKIIKYINHNAVSLIPTVFIMLPGIIGILSLHPYEYIYYNSFVGGVSGAAKNFETDYYLTSYREAASYLNTHAPIGARVLVWGARYNIDHNARKDLQIYGFYSEDEIQEIYDYAVITTRFDTYRSIFPNAKTVFEVRKNGVLLAVVKKLTE